MSTWTLDDLAHLIDHTNLRADATEADIATLCDEARRYHFNSVAVNQAQVAFCARQLLGWSVLVDSTVSFPLGQTSIEMKALETRAAIADGSGEIDYVVNVGKVKEHDWTYVTEEMRQIVALCDEAGIPSKAIFETCYLTDEEKVRLCEIAREVKPTFVKTSTGFGTAGATVEDVRLMREHAGDRVQVKAAGGIRDADAFLAMVRAGATRIGTSAGIKIIEELKRRMDEECIKSYEL